jgi:hypothetical protein
LYKGMSASYLGRSRTTVVIMKFAAKTNWDIEGVAEGTIQWVIYEHLKKRQMEAKAERLLASGILAHDSNAHKKSVQGMWQQLIGTKRNKSIDMPVSGYRLDRESRSSSSI